MDVEDLTNPHAAKKSIEGAARFEWELRDFINKHLESGVSVSQVTGILELVKTEINISMCISKGMIKAP